MTKLVDALHPPDPKHEADSQRGRALRQIESTSGAMHVAEEFESIFGRNALDDLIIREVPDLDHEPGALYRLMLKLPWADVLTTNWDTLLERAARTVLEQRYDVVTVSEDLPRASRPRIVKLHGTLPSNRPFIFTEEDFRTYQDRFPIFVNLVRQTMAENILCLVGFSGDDPNFLYWSGWVRDTLGKAAPRVYLCGLLDNSASQRKLLADRNVMTVDLSPLFPVASWPDPAERHSRALEWFFLALETGRPQDTLAWPEVKPVPATAPSTPSLPPRPAVARQWVKAEPFQPQPTNPQHLTSAVALWQHNRAFYPGWVVAPPKVRRRLWEYTERWIAPLMYRVSELPPWQRLLWLDVLNWRLERCLVPVWPDLAALMRNALDACPPFADGFSVPLGDTGDGVPPDLAELRRIWTRLAYALLRYHREAIDDEAFSRLDAMLKPVAEATPWLWDAISYERCLLALERLEHGKAVSALLTWRGRDDDPMWDVRRAALLALLGHRRKARELAEHALAEVRRLLGPGGGDVGLSSREGWVLLVLMVLDHEEMGSESAERRGRREELGRILCDPWEGIGAQMEELRRDPPQRKPRVSTSVGFDPGSRSRHHHLANEGLLPRLMPAYTLLRLVEDGGVLVWCGNTSLVGSGLGRAGTWLADDLQINALRAALRSGCKEGMDSVFSRHRVAILPEAMVQILFQGALATLAAIADQWQAARAAEEGSDRDVLDDRLRTSGEIASRLLVRLDRKAACTLTDVGLRLWKALSIHFGQFRMDRLHSLIERALEALPAPDVAERLPVIFGTPLAMERAGDDLIALLPDQITWTDVDITAVAGQLRTTVATLLDTVADAAGAKRNVALFRLLWLLKNGLLMVDAADRLAHLLWKRPESGALDPTFDDVNRAALLDHAGPLLGTAREALRHYLLEGAALRRQRTEDGGNQAMPTGSDEDWLMQTISATKRPGASERIDWAPEEAERLWDIAVDWWETEGQGLLRQVNQPIVGNSASDRLVGFLEFIRMVVLPRQPAHSPRWPETRQIIDAIDGAGIPASRVFPALLRVFPEQLTATVSTLRSELVHSDEARVGSALLALRYWFLEASAGDHPEPPGDLLQLVGALVANRRVPALAQALNFLTDLTRKKPQALTPEVVKATCTGLGYLLTELAYRQQREGGRGSVRFDEVPDYRARVVALAAALHAAGHRCPEAERWLELASHDPLPNVRAAGGGAALRPD